MLLNLVRAVFSIYFCDEKRLVFISALVVNWWGWLYKYLNSKLQLIRFPPPLPLKSKIRFSILLSCKLWKLSLKNLWKLLLGKEKLFTFKTAVLSNAVSILKSNKGCWFSSKPLYLFFLFIFLLAKASCCCFFLCSADIFFFGGIWLFGF